MSKKCNWCDDELDFVEQFVLEDPLFETLSVRGVKENQTSSKIIGKTTTKTPTCKQCINHFKKSFEEVKKKKKYTPEKGKENMKKEYDKNVKKSELCELCGLYPRHATFTSVPIKSFNWISDCEVCRECHKEISERARDLIRKY